MAKYICTKDPNHIFDQNTADGNCSVCWAALKQTQESAEPRDIGLTILLMDASGSMKTKAFPTGSASRAELVIKNAAEGILSLSNLSNKKDAYVMPVLFDHEVHPLFIKSVEELASPATSVIF